MMCAGPATILPRCEDDAFLEQVLADLLAMKSAVSLHLRKPLRVHVGADIAESPCYSFKPSGAEWSIDAGEVLQLLRVLLALRKQILQAPVDFTEFVEVIRSNVLLARFDEVLCL